MDNVAGGYDPHVELAKAAIRAYTERGARVRAEAGGITCSDGQPCPSPVRDYTRLLDKRAGVFVSIKKRGALRGCIGTISPIRASIAEEIAENAVNACSRDPRFEPVVPAELDDLTVSVDVLSDAEPVDSAADLDPKRYGVIVSRGYRRGLLLPNLEGVDTVEYQIGIALSKAGINPSERFDLERFEVVRHETGGSMRGED